MYARTFNLFKIVFIYKILIRGIIIKINNFPKNWKVAIKEKSTKEFVAETNLNIVNIGLFRWNVHLDVLGKESPPRETVPFSDLPAPPGILSHLASTMTVN